LHRVAFLFAVTSIVCFIMVKPPPPPPPLPPLPPLPPPPPSE
jgi:hypothetical protein